MSRRRLITLVLGILAIGGTGFYLWAIELVRGTEVCVRCGAQREVACLGPFRTSPTPGPSSERSWAEAHIGPCLDHAWQRSGCWYSGNRVSCTMIPDGHSLMAALANLGDEASEEIARRFGALPREQQVELWGMANRLELPSDLTGHEREVACAVAEQAGWGDLTPAWPH